MSFDSALETILKRDRRLVLAALMLLVALAWIYLIAIAASINSMNDAMAALTQMRQWMLLDGLLTFIMWLVMMIGMMLPSATPIILLYARVSRKRGGQPYASVAFFLVGYLLVWTLFSAGATVLQWGLVQLGLLSAHLVNTSPLLGGILLIVAGIYQWSPIKHACLHHCRSPIDFLANRWATGTAGALRMGVEHGIYCLGCCWPVMLLLFIGGVMNLLWIAAIALFVLAEKVTVTGHKIGQVGAIALILIGLTVLAHAIG